MVVAIGGNDFAPWAGGPIPDFPALGGAALDAKINDVVTHITTAVNTGAECRIGAGDPTTVGDFEMSPQIVTIHRYSDASKRLVIMKVPRCSASTTAFCAGCCARVGRHGSVMPSARRFFAQVVNGFIVIDGVAINVNTAGDDPHNLILGDHIHGGTVLEGLIANAYIQQINTLVDPDIPVFQMWRSWGTPG